MAKQTIPKERLLGIKNEIIMAEKLNEEELRPIVQESLERYVGEFIPDVGAGWDIRLNEIYPVIQFHLPSIFFRNPRAFLKPRSEFFIVKKRNPSTGEMEETQEKAQDSARTQEHILNYTISQIGYKRQTRKVLLDALLFPYGVMWHGYKGNFGMTEEQSIDVQGERVFVSRLSPLRFLYDPSVTIATLDEAKWIARKIDIPLLDIIEDDKLNVTKDLKGKLGFGEKIGTKTALDAAKINRQGEDIHTLGAFKKPLIDFADEAFKNSKASRFVTVYEVYMRPTKKEARDGSKGKILLLTDEQSDPLRVNDWKIKAEGWPAKILQFNELNDHIFGLEDVATYKSIADQKNIISNIQLRNATELSKTWVGISKAGADEETIEHVQKGDNTIILFEDGNPRERMYIASGGGQASSELYLIDGRIQRNLEDKSGVTDLKRGFLQSGEESATSVKLRAAGGGARPAYRQDIMSDFLKGSFLYLLQLNKQFISFNKAVRISGTLDVQWSEKPTKEMLQADVDVEIDVISMLPENPEKELREYNTILMLMIQAIQSPSIMAKINKEGKTFNISPLIDQMLIRMRIRDSEVFRGIKPEESEGFVSVKQVREAKRNVTAALEGTPLPFPPKKEDDHVAKLEMYTSISALMKQLGQVSDTLEQLIQIHSQILQEIEAKENPQAGQQLRMPQAKVETV